ncbi:MAG: phosphoserine phosphatase SerB, partial [Alphaproteobacteria bacterium]|nr:phosphoserine phosphatase SerB [Alphaproteobacteria bacterium]
MPVDLAVQPAAGRRKRLMLADMDSTMVTGETLDEMAAHAGLKDVIAAITRRSMNGELDFPTALRERVAMLAGLPEQAIAATLAAMDYSPGAATAVATMRAHGCRCVLISGGFAPFTARVRAALGFDEDHANRLEMAGGKLTGRLVEPILDKDAKLATLRRRAADLGLGLDATLTVGDGANDLPMLTAASAGGGIGVAWRGKPAVAAQARYRLDHADLTGLLWLQGYREREVVRPG